jgi:NADPH:quinone reductase-like Zn-dependent oxidoreductase
MKAAVLTQYGPPEVVRVTEVDTPVPKDDEVLVRVHATTVNRTDCGFRAGTPFITRFFAGERIFAGLVRPTVTVLGTEFAGEVQAVGSGVTAFKMGDRVFGYSGRTFGAHAEYMTIREGGSLTTIPTNMTFDQAAPGTEGSHYALSLIRGAKIRGGQSVLVYGATGAIGSAAVQLLKSIGAEVTAVCDTENLALVAGLGADRVIDYTVEDFTKDEHTYDVVLDAVGKSSFSRCRRLLKPRGIYLSSEPGSISSEPDFGTHHPDVQRQEGTVSDPARHPGDRHLFEGTDGVRRVQTGCRPTISTGPDRRCLSIRGEWAKDRKRRDRHSARERAASLTILTSPFRVRIARRCLSGGSQGW